LISRETIDEVKNRVDIVDVVSDFVSLKKSGQNYKALSPFANEKTPSFFVVPSKGIFKDFSSGKGGDAFTFDGA
jgi:DNA primase